MDYLIPRFTEAKPRREVYIQRLFPPQLIHQAYVDKHALLCTFETMHPHFYNGTIPTLNCFENLSVAMIGYNLERDMVIYQVLGPFRAGEIPSYNLPALSCMFSYFETDAAIRYPREFEIFKSKMIGVST